VSATYAVYRDDVLVLTVRPGPGRLVSTAPRAPGESFVTHPFVSATAHEASTEAALRALLDAAADLDDFLGALRAAGYRVTRTA
jgi:hypothetical protein